MYDDLTCNEPQKPQKPLTNEQVWGLPDEQMPGQGLSDDLIIEELLVDGGDDDLSPYREPEFCPECGEPGYLCDCGNDEN